MTDRECAPGCADSGERISAAAISAYVPCYNNRHTVRHAVESLLRQTVAPTDVVVVDDGSTDDSLQTLSGLNVRIVRLGANLGRGAVRARAMQEARGALVVCCDATMALDLRFIERSLSRFDDQRVAAVVGRLTQRSERGVVDRWRGRHLFKMDALLHEQRDADFATGGCMLRASAAAAVGGFDPRLRQTEDGELGRRLRAAGFDVIYDPGLEVISVASNTLPQVMERYWRWYAGLDRAPSWRAYLKTVIYSIKAMAAADLRAGDPLSVPISLAMPHYQFWRSVFCRRQESSRTE